MKRERERDVPCKTTSLTSQRLWRSHSIVNEGTSLSWQGTIDKCYYFTICCPNLRERNSPFSSIIFLFILWPIDLYKGEVTRHVISEAKIIFCRFLIFPEFSSLLFFLFALFFYFSWTFWVFFSEIDKRLCNSSRVVRHLRTSRSMCCSIYTGDDDILPIFSVGRADIFRENLATWLLKIRKNR